MKTWIAFLAGIVLALAVALLALRKDDLKPAEPSQTEVAQAPRSEPSANAVPPPPTVRETAIVTQPAVEPTSPRVRPTTTTNRPAPPVTRPGNSGQARTPPQTNPGGTGNAAPPPPVNTAGNSGASQGTGSGTVQNPAANTTPPTTTAANTTPPPVVEPAPPVRPAEPNRVTVPTGTTLNVRLAETLTSEQKRTGDGFQATLDQPLIVDGFILAERGSRVEGKLIESVDAGRVQGVAQMSITLTHLYTSDGQKIALNTTVFKKQGESSKGSDAAKVGVGAAIGAALGGIFGGGKGAAIGAGAGAGAGTGVVLATKGKPAVLPVETRVAFNLMAPVTIVEKR